MLPPSPQTFPKATLFPISPGYYRGDITVVRSPPPPQKKNEDSAYAKFGVGGGGEEVEIGFGRLCSKKRHIMLLAVLIFFRNYAKIMLLSENYALCHRNYAT